MLNVKTAEQIKLIRQACKIVGDTLKVVEDNIRVGMTTAQLDKVAYDFIVKCGARPNFLHYNGFPASSCISIDEEVVHGFPSKHRFIEEGQIVSVDLGATIHGYNGDAARTFCIGEVSPAKRQLVEVTKECFFKALTVVKGGVRLGDIGFEVSSHAHQFGYGVVTELVGHGIGSQLHEDPNIPNYGFKGRGIRLPSNMTICIEPMINMGTPEVVFSSNGWTALTKDGQPSAHYENTILITDDGAEILTL